MPSAPHASEFAPAKSAVKSHDYRKPFAPVAFPLGKVFAMSDPWDELRANPQEMAVAVATIKAAGVSKTKLAGFLKCERQDITGWMDGKHKPDPIRACMVFAVLDSLRDERTRASVIERVTAGKSETLLNVLRAGLTGSDSTGKKQKGTKRNKRKSGLTAGSTGAGAGAAAGAGIGAVILGPVGAAAGTIVGSIFGSLFGSGSNGRSRSVETAPSAIEPLSSEGAAAWDRLSPDARVKLVRAATEALAA